MTDTYYITTAIDYANAPPHLGHAYEKIAADCLARYHRLRCGAENVFFLTGTDEHGLKIERKAKEAGVSPQEFVDQMAGAFKAAWAALGISYSRFIRTTEAPHREQVQRIFARLIDQGDVVKARYEGWYCSGCEEFKAERDLLEGRICPNHERPAEWTSEENYVFDMARYRDRLRAKIESDPHFVQPEFRRKEVLNLLEGFPNLSVSRQSVKWGIPVPGDPEHVVYVWIDALSNYLTGIGYGRDEATFSRWWPADVHLVGKDISKFHAILWPAILMALDLPLPRQIFVHGFVLLDAEKMSKSTGNVVDPLGLAEKYGPDPIRYYLLREVNFGRDGDFTYEAFEKRVNADLANNLGNALNRILTFAERHFDNHISRPATEAPEAIRMLEAAAELARERFVAGMEALALHDALAAAWELLDQLNMFVDRQAPWALAKQEDKTPLQHVVWSVLETLRVVAIMVWPTVPTLAAKIWEQIGTQGELLAERTDRRWEHTRWGAAPDGSPEGSQLAGERVFVTRKTGPVYPRIGTEIVGKAGKK